MNKTVIKGRAIALVSKYTDFDQANPEKTPAHAFMLVSERSVNDDGELDRFLSKDGYVMVGTAEITVTLLGRKSMTAGAVKSLRAEKARILAEAQREATRIEERIQSLLAIEYEAAQ